MHELVPRFILDKFEAGEKRGLIQAAVMFIDISGFSLMADSLGKHGHQGSEVLASVMQSIFGPLVDCIYENGGFVVGYDGDAITSVFTDDNIQLASLRCASAAAFIQHYFTKHPQHQTSLGSFLISAKLGLSSGELIWEIFYSSVHQKATYCFRGNALEAAVSAEHRSKPGDILLHPSIHREISESCSGEWQDCFFRLDGFRARLSEKFLFEAKPHISRYLDLFFPKDVINLTHAGEFRPLVIVFIDLSTDVLQEDQMDRFIQVVFDLQTRYGGFFLRPDFGDKGVNLLIFWGAPIVQENDIERALNFLLELKDKSQTSFSAGISYQLTFTGFIGASQREDYTGYGWGIALSARMMKSAQKGELWVDEQVAHRVNHLYNFSEPEARSFKGFVTKQNVYQLLGCKESASQDYPGNFEGRKQEIQELVDFVEPLWQNRFAGTLRITGDAGIGKSRLLYEFQHSENLKDRKFEWAYCQPDEIVRRSLNPFRYWLFRYFDIQNDKSASENLHIFLDRIQHLADATTDEELGSELKRTRSFLGALLDLYWEDSLYSQLDAKERNENTLIALSTLIRCLSMQKPMILHMEDAHWFDEETRNFLPYLVRTLTADENRNYPVAIIATTRMEGEPDKSTTWLPDRELALMGLGAKSLKKLAQGILGGPVSAELVEFLRKRVESNPYFVEQALIYLSESKLLRKKKRTFHFLDTRQVDLLSTDIQSILVSRLDHLTHEVRNVVQSAALLGREFDIRLLEQMLNDEALPGLVHQAEKSSIWVPLGRNMYSFRHALMRDAAYSMMLRSQQQKLHEMAVEAIENVFAQNLDQYYGKLAYHSEQAQHVEKSRKYLELAGHDARDQFQNARALDYYQGALKFTPEDDLEKRYDLHLSREKILTLWDLKEERKSVLEEINSLAEKLNDGGRLIEARLRKANFLQDIGEYQAAGESARDAIMQGEKIDRYDLVCKGYLLLCDSLLRQGKPSEAVDKGLIGVELASQRDFPLRSADLLNLVGLALLESEPSKANAYFKQALGIFRVGGDIRRLILPINNMGNLAGMQGDFVSAQSYYKEALSITREVGNRKGESVLLNNLSWISGLMGDYRKARALGERNLRICREVGERYTETYTLINLSSANGVLGEYGEAIKYAQQGLSLARQSGE
ncbi:MAG: tetratricopeptide repeat protein, partial [Anaerolineales bacterium]